ncbi:hypothetical protein KJ359_008415 [Pestalotiopsis sp. 9143b]|nr:hypothetical protein KJ359_008415 [Pestalotiopsis sp. 9143b]
MENNTERSYTTTQGEMFLMYTYEDRLFRMDISYLDAEHTGYLLEDFGEAFETMSLVERPRRYGEDNPRDTEDWKEIYAQYGWPDVIDALPTLQTDMGTHVETISGLDITASHEVQLQMALGCLSTPSFEVLSEKRVYHDFIRQVFFRYYMNHLKHWIENDAHIYSVSVNGHVRGGCMAEEIDRRAMSWRYSDVPRCEIDVNNMSGVEGMQDFWNAGQALKLRRAEFDALKWLRDVNENKPFWYLSGIHIGPGQVRGTRGLEVALLRQIIQDKGAESGIFVLCEHDELDFYRSAGFKPVDFIQICAERIEEDDSWHEGDCNRTHLHVTLTGMWRPTDIEACRCAVDRGEVPRTYRPEVIALFSGHADGCRG